MLRYLLLGMVYAWFSIVRYRYPHFSHTFDTGLLSRDNCIFGYSARKSDALNSKESNFNLSSLITDPVNSNEITFWIVYFILINRLFLLANFEILSSNCYGFDGFDKFSCMVALSNNSVNIVLMWQKH